MAAAKPPQDGSEIPDLGLPVKPTRAAAPARPQGPKAAVPAVADFGWLDDDGPAPAASPRKSPPAAADFDMDWRDDGRAGGGKGSAYAGGGFELGDGFDDDFADEAGGPGVDVAAAVPDQPKRKLPTGLTPTAEELDVTVTEVATVAGYGPKPAAFYLCPPYALRVYQRRRSLRGRVKELTQVLEKAEAERDIAFADLAANWRPRIAKDERFQSLLGKVDDAEARLRVENEGLAQASAQFREQAAGVDAQRDQLEKKRAALLAVEAELDAELAAREADLERAQAQLKRLQIVLRNAAKLEAAARDPEAGVRLPPDHAATVATAQVKLAPAQQAFEAERARVKAADAEVRKGRAATQVINKELRALDAQHRQLQVEYTRESSTRSALVSDGERQRRSAWADVTRALLGLDLAAELADDEVAELLAHDARVRRAATELERHVRALDAYDRESYQLGVLVAGSLVGVIVLTLLLGIGFTACGSGAAPPAGTRPAAPRAQPTGDKKDDSFRATEDEWNDAK